MKCAKYDSHCNTDKTVANDSKAADDESISRFSLRASIDAGCGTIAAADLNLMTFRFGFRD